MAALTADARLLADLRVLDLTGPEGQLTGRLLADLGATVVKPEPPEGDPTRRLGPFAGNGTAQESLLFAFLNSGKRSIVLDPTDDDDRAVAERLASWADLIVMSFDHPYGSALVGDAAELPDRLGRVVVHVSAFGLGAPENALQTDLTIFALSGLLNISGSPDLPPCSPPEAQAYYYGSVWAALAGLSTLYHRDSAAGDFVDVSLCEALTTQEALIRAAASGDAIERDGSQHRLVCPSNLFPTSDGLVQLHVNHTAWQRFLKLLDGAIPELEDERWADMDTRLEHVDRINALISDFTSQRTKEDLVDRAQRLGVACMPVNMPSEVLADTDMRERGAFVSVEHATLGRYLQPAAPYVIDGDRVAGATPPALGGDRPAVMELLEDGSRPHAVSAGEPDESEPTPSVRERARLAGNLRIHPRAPLHGIRVATFTSGVAGPRAGRILAWLGADVIKIESRNGGIDAFRYFGKSADPDTRLESSQRFAESNLNVSSITLDLKSAEGHRIARELVATCDVVMDNYRSGVLKRLGLSDEVLREINPQAVVLHMPGFGSGGRREGFGTWGPSVNAFTGMTALWNHHGQDSVVGTQSVYPDYLAAVFGPLAVVAGLTARDRTGRGVAIEYSQVEGAIYMLGVNYLLAAIEGPDPVAQGNERPDSIRSGLLACAGDDRWCAFAIRDESDLAAVSRLTGASDLADTDAVLQRLEEWASTHPPTEVMAALRDAGVPAGTVRKGTELLDDAMFRKRGFVRAVEQPYIGRLLVPYLPVTFRRAVTEPVFPAPRLGSSNERVFHGDLGHGRGEMREWEASGALS